VNTRELAAARVPFSRNFLKWAPLGLCRSIFDEEKSYTENDKKNQSLEMVDVTFVLTVPSLSIN
jgi:hypothetical protein